MKAPYQYADIDLTKLDETLDDKDIIRMLVGFCQSDSDSKILPARQWVEHFFYYSGLRDLAAMGGSTTVLGNSLLNPLQFANRSQMPFVNRRRVPKVFKAIQIQAANITRQRPTIKAWPLDDSEPAYKKAKLSNIVVDYLWEHDQEEATYYEAILWCLLTPAVARKDYLDYSFNASRLWPKMDQQGLDPVTGQPHFVEERDANGNLVLDQLPWNRSEITSAFRLLFNPMATWSNDLDFIGDISVKRMGWIRDNYDRDEEGYFPQKIKEMKPGNWGFTACMGMEIALKEISFGSSRIYRNSHQAFFPSGDYVVHINFFFKPTRNFPRGREIAIANNEVVYDGQSRVYRAEPIRWHPYAVSTYERVPGRLWGTTYAEKIIDIARAYEQARTELDELRRTFSKPKMALPIGAQIERDTVLGSEQVLRYNPFGPNGGQPNYLNAPQPPSTILDDIKLTAQDFTEASGMTEIALGMNPKGVTTYRSLEVLREEMANSGNNIIRTHENFLQLSQSNKLENIRKSLVYPDKNMVNAVRIFKKMNSYVSDIDIYDFTGADLMAHIKVEPLSTVGKSRLALQEKYMSMAQMGVLGDIVNDPDLNQEFKRKMDVIGFEPPQNKQVIYAKYENQLMLSSDDKRMPIIPKIEEYHDDMIHIREIDMMLLDPMLERKPLAKQAMLAHRAAHQQQMAVKQMQAAQTAAMQAAAGMGVEGGAPGQSAPAAPTPGNPGMAAAPQDGIAFAPEGFNGGGMNLV